VDIGEIVGLIKHAEDTARRHHAFDTDCVECGEILATLRLVPKLIAVVEAARDIDFGFVTGRKAPERATLVEMDDQLQRLKAALAALDAGEGV